MTPTEVINYFDCNKSHAAKNLHVCWQTVNNWELRGAIPPSMQKRIEWLTNGKLLADSTLEAAEKVRASEASEDGNSAGSAGHGCAAK